MTVNGGEIELSKIVNCDAEKDLFMIDTQFEAKRHEVKFTYSAEIKDESTYGVFRAFDSSKERSIENC
jgi:hypothetical protein